MYCSFYSFLSSPSAEIVELSEDVHLREVERSLIRMVGEGLLCLLEAALVLLVESLAVLQLLEYNASLLVPDLIVPTLRDVRSASCYHLIGHLDKESCHPLRGVVVSRVAVDHSNGIDQSRNGIQHRHLNNISIHKASLLSKGNHTYWVAVVERFTVFLQSVEKLDIIFCLIGEVSDSHVLLLPRLKERN